ncbi:transporter [Glaesserella australis]|uniref:Transporter n=1 Tax=Glaesserella australis TaxID=2094024 RepID=A0A328BZ82_9PAST|nr:transporter [Glaesserella sp. 15-184]RAL18955.1 transporter [Glaesserella australis]
MQPVKWKAEAQFEAPKVVDLGNYYSLLSTYNLLKGETSATATADAALTNSVYQEFIRDLKSPDVLQQFLIQSEKVKKQASDKNQPTSLVAQEIARQFKFDDTANTLSLTLLNPEEASTLLADFVIFSTMKARSTLNSELIAKWKILFQQTKQMAESNLGAIQQGAQVAQQDWAGKLNLMRSVKPLDDRLLPFRYIKAPSVPTVPEKPENQLLWSAIGAGIGFFLGLLIALFIHRKRN